MKIADISVQLVDKMGDDKSVVNAARVSFDKLAENYSDSDNTNLIRYLANHNHWSPFSHAFVSFRIKAPIFVARQLVKHVVGLSWNEVSRRYVDSEPEFYMPNYWRKRSTNVKQGSSEEDAGIVHGWIEDQVRMSLITYEQLLKNEVCPEQARMILPQNTMTTWVWSGSLYAFARVCNLRLDSHTQRETQEVAKLISNEMSELFPVSWNTLVLGDKNV